MKSINEVMLEPLAPSRAAHGWISPKSKRMWGLFLILVALLGYRFQKGENVSPSGLFASIRPPVGPENPILRRYKLNNGVRWMNPGQYTSLKINASMRMHEILTKCTHRPRRRPLAGHACL